MTALAAEFFTLDEVNRLKIIQDVIDRRLTTQIYVDDATSRLMQLLFVKSESTFTYFEATRGYIEKHGKPLALCFTATKPVYSGSTIKTQPAATAIPSLAVRCMN
jgi:hypothetical protein